MSSANEGNAQQKTPVWLIPGLRIVGDHKSSSHGIFIRLIQIHGIHGLPWAFSEGQCIKE